MSAPLQFFQCSSQSDAQVRFLQLLNDPVVLASRVSLSDAPFYELNIIDLSTSGLSYKFEDQAGPTENGLGVILIAEAGAYQIEGGGKFAATKVAITDDWTSVVLPLWNGTELFSKTEWQTNQVVPLAHVVNRPSSDTILSPLVQWDGDKGLKIKLQTFSGAAPPTADVHMLVMSSRAPIPTATGQIVAEISADSSLSMDSSLLGCGPLTTFGNYYGIDERCWPRICSTMSYSGDQVSCPIEKISLTTDASSPPNDDAFEISNNLDAISLLRLQNSQCDGILEGSLGTYDERMDSTNVSAGYNTSWVLPFVLVVILTAFVGGGYYFYVTWRRKTGVTMPGEEEAEI